MRRISDDERRARLGRRHRLAPASAAPATPEGVVDVARSLVAFHATDPASVYLSARARLAGGGSPDDVSRALYDDRTLVRMLGMRRTMFVVPTTFVPVVQAGATDAIAERETRRLLKLLGEVGIPEPERWLADARAATLAALEARGEALAVELSADVPALRTRSTYAEGKPYGGEVTLTSQIMNGLGSSGAIVRGRPRGTWAGSQYRWAPTASWLGDTLP
ncbi:MAG TPA: crosslink repair DNA glycosylase YcaQ family protein, partial [Acidimicrobiales bacterium]